MSESKINFSFTLKTENEESIETVKFEEVELTSTSITIEELRGLEEDLSDTVKVIEN